MKKQNWQSGDTVHPLCRFVKHWNFARYVIRCQPGGRPGTWLDVMHTLSYFGFAVEMNYRVEVQLKQKLYWENAILLVFW